MAKNGLLEDLDSDKDEDGEKDSDDSSDDGKLSYHIYMLP